MKLAALPGFWGRHRFLVLLLAVGLALGTLCQLGLNWLEGYVQREAEAHAEQRIALRADTAQHLVETLLQGMEPLFVVGQQWAQLQPPPGQPASPYRALLEERLRWGAEQGHFGVFQVAVLDANGLALWSTVGEPSALNLADREHFQAHLHADIGTYVSRPMLGRLSHRWTIQLSRRVIGAEGQFAGVVVLSLDPFILAGEFSRLSGTREMDVTLFRTDGVLLARSTNPAEALQRGFLAQQLPGPNGRLDVRRVGRFTGLESFISVRYLGSTPFVVAVSSPAASQMREFLRFCALLNWVRGGLLLLMLGGGALVMTLRASKRAAQNAAALQQRSTEQARVLDALPMAVYIAVLGRGRPRHVTFTNVHYQRLWQARPAGNQGPYLQDPPLSPAERGELYDKLEQQGAISLERQYYHPDGMLRWARWDAKVIGRSDEGMETLITITDIETERAAAVAVATTSRLATLGEVSAALAHELNQPLAVISLSAEISQMLAQDCPPEAAEPLVARQQVIVDMVKRVKTITDHLRLFARSDAEEQEAVELATVMRGTLALIGGALQQAEVKLELDLPEELPPVWGSQVLLEQVLMNLLLNARDALASIPPAQRRVRVAASAEKGKVTLLVTDNGTGIPEPMLQRLFEPFFTTKPQGHGTGLGLSICFGILRACEGSITAANVPEGGAQFTITLQTAELEDEEAEAEWPEQATEAWSRGPARSAPARGKLESGYGRTGDHL